MGTLSKARRYIGKCLRKLLPVLILNLIRKLSSFDLGGMGKPPLKPPYTVNHGNWGKTDKH